MSTPCLWRMQAVQLHNLGHLFDDLDKTGSEASVCPETPLHFFPNTPTSERLLHSQLGQMLPETQTPPQVGAPCTCSPSHTRKPRRLRHHACNTRY